MKLVVLGANGSLGSHVTRLALQAGHTVTAAVRNPAKLANAALPGLTVQQADLSTIAPQALAEILRGHDALINTAGFVTDGDRFVSMLNGIVEAVEALSPHERPVCWFLAGAGLLDLDSRGRRGLDLPKVRDTYWPHAKNHMRLQKSELDWRMLCPGPMVESPPLGVDRMRIGTERIPVNLPSWAARLPKLLLLVLFAQRMPEMIVSYADAAALILAHLEPGGTFRRQRVGLALPKGMRGSKNKWVAGKT
jgi:putative NADH-flavin reductase